MTNVCSNELIAKLKEILSGIDKTETESEIGWWETSAGAKFGELKLKEVLSLFDNEQNKGNFNT